MSLQVYYTALQHHATNYHRQYYRIRFAF